MQLGLFRLDLPASGEAAPAGKTAPARLCVPGFFGCSTRFRRANGAAWRFPARCNSSTCACKRSNSFCSLRLLTLQPLVVGTFSYQFQLQFSDPLVFRTGLGVLIPFAAHPTKFTASRFLRSESFGLRFSEV